MCVRACKCVDCEAELLIRLSLTPADGMPITTTHGSYRHCLVSISDFHNSHVCQPFEDDVWGRAGQRGHAPDVGREGGAERKRLGEAGKLLVLI